LRSRGGQALHDLVSVGEQGAEAPLRHAVVYQATGMIIAQMNVTAEAALALLRAAAFNQGRQLTDVARDVVAGRQRLGEETRDDNATP
jgi:AmiR/NasT family two-component response regulator